MHKNIDDSIKAIKEQRTFNPSPLTNQFKLCERCGTPFYIGFNSVDKDADYAEDIGGGHTITPYCYECMVEMAIATKAEMEVALALLKTSNLIIFFIPIKFPLQIFPHNVCNPYSNRDPAPIPSPWEVVDEPTPQTYLTVPHILHRIRRIERK